MLRKIKAFLFYLALALCTAAPSCPALFREPPFHCRNTLDESGLTPFLDESGMMGYLDANGKVAIPARFKTVPQYMGGSPFTEGLAPVAACEWSSVGGVRRCEHGKVGFIDTKGRFVIEPRFESARAFSEGLAAVRINDDAWGYIDRAGRVVVEPKYIRACDFEGGKAQVRTIEFRNLRMDRSGKELY